MGRLSIASMNKFRQISRISSLFVPGDAVRAIVHVLDDGVYEGGVYNAVSVNITVRQVIDSIRRLVPGLEINLVDSPIMNQLSFKVMNSRLAAESFVPQGSLDAAVEETVSMLRNANSF